VTGRSCRCRPEFRAGRTCPRVVWHGRFGHLRSSLHATQPDRAGDAEVGLRDGKSIVGRGGTRLGRGRRRHRSPGMVRAPVLGERTVRMTEAKGKRPFRKFGPHPYSFHLLHLPSRPSTHSDARSEQSARHSPSDRCSRTGADSRSGSARSPTAVSALTIPDVIVAGRRQRSVPGRSDGGRAGRASEFTSGGVGP
jgi:hypothetical protein